MDELPSLEPLHFFAINADLLHWEGTKGNSLPKSYLLPNLSPFFGEDSFAKVFMAWNERGIFLNIAADSRVPKVFFPDIQKGDSVELFFDTRDMKNTHGIHRFCHHFFFLPQIFEYEGEKVQSGEITRFRGEEKHELADPHDLFVICEEKGRGGYVMYIFIPQESLFGYDPKSFNRLGFTYRINRGGRPQFFSASAEEYPIEKYPALWSSLILR